MSRPSVARARSGAAAAPVADGVALHIVAGARRADHDDLTLLRSLPCMLFVLDVQRNEYVYVSRKSLQWFGYPDDFPPDRLRMLQHTHPDDHARVRRLLARVHDLEDGQSLDIEFRSRPLQGRWRTFLSQVSVYRRTPDGRVEWIIGTAQDITDRLELEHQLRQAQKMEAVGQLAGGIAHDFNNLLTVILGHAETLSSQLLREDPLRADAAQIVLAGRRATLLTQQLLSAARRQASDPVPMDLNAACRSVETILRRVIRPDIDIRFEPERDLRPILGDPAQVDQVLMNLAVNARDAMPDGGMLTLSTANVDVGEGDPWHRRGASAGAHVRLRVADTGAGMDAAVRARIFEPFFTTKPAHRGTGLGLSVVYGIVQQARGRIHVESAPGQGACFDLLFPATAASDAVMAGPEEVSILPHGLETILLVEDDAGVRRMAREGLEAYGYHVLEADCAEKALALADDFGRTIHLAVTDLVMPGMSGGAFARALAERYPRTRILFVSGYAADAPSEQADGSRAWSYLQKPFTPAALARAVRRALTPSPASP